MFEKMMAAKQVNDGNYWTVMREVFAEQVKSGKMPLNTELPAA